MSHRNISGGICLALVLDQDLERPQLLDLDQSLRCLHLRLLLILFEKAFIIRDIVIQRLGSFVHLRVV